jgi:hypothetical protein
MLLNQNPGWARVKCMPTSDDRKKPCRTVVRWVRVFQRVEKIVFPWVDRQGQRNRLLPRIRRCNLWRVMTDHCIAEMKANVMHFFHLCEDDVYAYISAGLWHTGIHKKYATGGVNSDTVWMCVNYGGVSMCTCVRWCVSGEWPGIKLGWQRHAHGNTRLMVP